MLWQPTYHKRAAQFADFFTTFGSFVISYLIWNWIRLSTSLGVGKAINLEISDLFWIVIFSILWVILFEKFNAYTFQRFTSLVREYSIVFKVSLCGILIILASFFLFRFKYIPRSYILIFLVINYISLVIEKSFLFCIANQLRRRGVDRKKVLAVLDGEDSFNILEKIKENIGWGLDIVGILKNGVNSYSSVNVNNNKAKNFNNEFVNFIHKNPVDEVIICTSDESLSRIKNIFDICEKEGIRVRLISDFFSKIAKRITIDYVYNTPIISFFHTHYDEWALYIKRLMDIMISSVMLLILLPIFIIIAIAIKLDSKGPIFYEWNVVGFNKKPFKSWKFRTMIAEADKLKAKLLDKNEMKGPVFKMKNDPRVTKVGRFLRKYSLDELPQLWSVLKGDMSLVGPRPAGPHELERYESWQRRKLSIKPGITCLWQVKGRNKINDFSEWVRLDLEYIDNWSIWLDIKILLMTIHAVVKGTGV